MSNLSHKSVPEWHDVDEATFLTEIAPAYRPAVLRGVARDWPAVKAASGSDEKACDYLTRFYRGAPVEAFLGAPEIAGRFFYRSDMAGFNFEKKRGRLTDVLRFILAARDADPHPFVYMGATGVDECLPGFGAENALALVESRPAVPRIWIGNDSKVATHYDLSDNIAVVVAGRRRFTLFPPDQVGNLYVGPIDSTMAGQPSSMVDLTAPDFELYPRFRDALEAAETAELEPGDAIYIPPLWWHNVEALARFNILLNYWWDEAPPDAGSPYECLAHGLMTISHLSEARRAAWRGLFDHYVFRANGDPAAHLPVERRGILGASTPEVRSRIKNFLQRTLGRR